MKNIIRRISTIFLLLALLGSCLEEQNFDQYDDLSLTPTFEGSIIYVETPENIINMVSSVDFFSQNFNFDAFAEDVFAERVLDGVIIYEVENSTSKQLEITIEFLDEEGAILDTENFSINPAPTSILRREIAYGDTGRSIDIIKNTSSISLNARNLGDNASTSNLSDPMITLKSSGKFRIRIK